MFELSRAMSSAWTGASGSLERSGNNEVSGARRRRTSSLPLTLGQSVFDGVAILLILASSAGGIWLFGGVRIWLSAPLMALTLAGCVMAAFRPLIFRHPDEISVPPGFLLMAAALGWAAFRAAASATPYEGWIEWVQFASLIFVYWAWTEMAQHQRRVRWMLSILILAVTLMALYAIVQDVRGSRMVLTMERMEGYGDRASGAYFCPNHFAHVLEMMFPFCAAMVLCGGAGFTLRLFAGYALVVMTPALYLTQSRSGWMATLAGLAVVFCARSWRRGGRGFLTTLVLTPVVLAAVAATAYFALPLVRQRVDNAMHGNMRVVLWKDTIEMIRAAPWTGHGLGSYRWRYPQWQHHYHEHMNPIYAHHEILHTWAEVGLVGLLLVSAFVIRAAIRFARQLRAAEREKDACMVMGWLGAVVATGVHSLFDYNLHLYANNHLLFALTGLTAAGLFSSGKWQGLPLRTAGRWVLPIGAALAALCLSGFATRAAVSEWWFLRAEAKREDFDFAEAETLYRRAIRWSPGNARPYRGLGDLRARQSFWNRVPEDRARQSDEALSLYAMARERNPWDMETDYGTVRVLRNRGDEAGALEVLERIVARNPVQAFYQLELGEALLRAGREEEALAAFERSYRVQASDAAGWHIQELKSQGVKSSLP